MTVMQSETQPTRSHAPIPSRDRGRILPALLFAVYLALLVWLVLWKLEPPYVGAVEGRIVKLVPFGPDSLYAASAPAEVAANVLIFLPFGVYLGLLAPARRWWATAVAALLASATLETLQYVLAVGASDVTDLITNTGGALLGRGALALATLGRGVAGTLARVCLLGTVLAVPVAVVFAASPLHYAQQDVHVPRDGRVQPAQLMPADER